MTEQEPHSRFGLSRETWSAYCALSSDELLYHDAQLIIASAADDHEAAAALEAWIQDQHEVLAGELGLYAQLLQAVDWLAVVQGFAPDDPRLVEDLLAREAYGLPPVTQFLPGELRTAAAYGTPPVSPSPGSFGACRPRR